MAAEGGGGGAKPAEETPEDPGFKVVLVSKEGDKYEINSNECKLSGMLSTMIEDAEDGVEIPLADVKSPVLEKTVEYLKHYAKKRVPDVDPPLRDRDLRKTGFDEWSASFIEEYAENPSMLFGLVLCANYINCPSLLNLGCAQIATRLEDTSVDEIKYVYADKIEYTEEELAQFAEQDKWTVPDAEFVRPGEEGKEADGAAAGGGEGEGGGGGED